MCCIKPCPHQQQCPSNIVECYKLNDSFDNVECCFDIVAIFGNNVAGFGNNVQRNFVLSTKWTCSICFDFVERTKLYNRIVRHCCCLWQQSRMLLRQSQTLLRHCCWCGWGITHIMFCCTQTWTLSVINWRPTSVNSLSHSASTGVDNICDGRRAEAKFWSPEFGDKVPDGNTLIFGDTRIPCRGKPLWQKRALSIQPFWYNTSLWSMDIHGVIANTNLAQCCAGKKLVAQINYVNTWTLSDHYLSMKCDIYEFALW